MAQKKEESEQQATPRAAAGHGSEPRPRAPAPSPGPSRECGGSRPRVLTAPSAPGLMDPYTPRWTLPVLTTGPESSSHPSELDVFLQLALATEL